MYEDEHVNFEASVSPRQRGGKVVEFRFLFSQIGQKSAFFIIWRNQLLLLQRIEKL